MNSLLSPYSLLACGFVLAAAASIDSKLRTAGVLLAAFSAILLYLIVAFRFEIGTDWRNYFTLFQDTYLGVEHWNIKHYEPGYLLLNSLIASLTSSYTMFLVCAHAISFSLVYYSIVKFSPRLSVSLMVFCSYVPIHFVGSIRRSVALALGLYAIALFARYGKRLKPFLVIVLGTLFHKTAVVCLLIFVMPKFFSASYRSLILALCIIVGFSVVGADRVLSMIAYLIPTDSSVGIFKLVLTYTKIDHIPDGLNPLTLSVFSLSKRIIYLIFFFLTFKELVKKAGSDSSLTNSYQVILGFYIKGLIFYAMFTGAPVVQNAANYFLIVEVLLVGYGVYILRKPYNLMLLIYAIFASLSSAISAMNVYPGLFFPYRSIFS